METTLRDTFVKALSLQASQDNSVMLLTGDLGFGVLDGFSKRFPSQFFNVGIAEQNMTALACGLALDSRRVFTYSIGNFPTLRCLEQIRNGICYHELDVTIVSVGAGFSYGQLGMSHFATEDLAIMRSLPNMTVLSPSDPWEVEELMKQLPNIPGPKYFRLDKGVGETKIKRNDIKVGYPRIVRNGSDVTIITTGSIVKEALVASQHLDKNEISTRVIYVNTLKPIDFNIILSAANETKMIVTLEEHNVIGGLAGAIAEVLLDNNTSQTKFLRLGIQDVFPKIVGDQAYLRAHFGIDAAGIAKKIIRQLSR